MVKPPAANHHQHGHGKIHPFLIGVPSISIRAIYTMAMVNNQRVTVAKDGSISGKSHFWKRKNTH